MEKNLDKRKLIFRISRLVKENKKLLLQVNKLAQINEQLQKEKKKLEHLISALKPSDIITQKENRERNSKNLRFKMATVLYLDIQGFKKISEQRNSTDVIDELDQILFRFDKIVQKYKIQKIKTIGDAYMCAGGVPVKNITNPIDVVLAALEMNQYLEKLKIEYESENKSFWNLRLGIHTGAVTANIHGQKKTSYDLKGDTVNIATRMASASDIGQINISIFTYELVQEYFLCDYFGEIPVKYKGDLKMYFVRRLKTEFSQIQSEGIFPNKFFKAKYNIRQFTDLQEIILDKLEAELPKHLYYHNCKHTIDVVNQAEIIGYGEDVDDEGILLLITAALFHDSGHIIGYDNHEYYGTEIARKYLPIFNYTPEQIDTICEIIMATKIPHNPKNLLEQIICDSDLDYLGRSDFIPVSNTLYEELKAQKKVDSLTIWNKMQVKFLTSHQFFTPTANRLREVNKQKQIDRISALIDEDQ